jgi:hypothetical protein
MSDRAALARTLLSVVPMRLHSLVFAPALVLSACTAVDLAPFQDCGGPIEACVVLPASCDVCALQHPEDVNAVRFTDVDDYADALDCEARECPAAERSRNPNLQARCDPQPDGGHRCVAFDIRTDAVWAACTTNGDCRVRTASCCECNGDWSSSNLIAVNRDFPGDGGRNCPGGCGGCLALPPDGIAATCVEGFCTLVLE